MELPAIPPLTLNAEIQAALNAAENSDDLPAPFYKLKDETLADALRAAKERAKEFDKAVGPLTKAAEQAAVPARLRFAAARYDAEARLNQSIANLYELQVAKSNFKADRHHKRSQRFFLGMLAAQAAVIISTFSLAAQKRSFLWSLAAAAGAAAVSFAIYVYVFI